MNLTSISSNKKTFLYKRIRIKLNILAQSNLGYILKLLLKNLLRINIPITKNFREKTLA